MPDNQRFVDAYDTRTGAKQSVPEAWITHNLFPHLTTDPAAATAAGQPVDPDPAPAKSASKADWVDYATRHGLTAAEADAMTRDELAAHDYSQEG